MKAKLAVVVFAILSAALPGLGQVALTPATPAITPSPVFVPGSPAITPPGATAGLVATNASLVALADALVTLQTNLQQTLPVLSLFNDNFVRVAAVALGFRRVEPD